MTSDRDQLEARLTRDLRALRMASTGTELARERRNETLRLMRGAGWKLAELAERTGLAISMLSKICNKKEET